MENLLTVDFGNINTINTTDMSNLFEKDYFLTGINLSNFDTRNVTNMNRMFQAFGYYMLTKLDLGSKFNTSKVTNMAYMFNRTGNAAMTTLDLRPAFKNIAATNTNIFSITGKSTGCTIKVSSAIYNNSNITLKRSATSTSTVTWSRTGTIVNAYTS